MVTIQSILTDLEKLLQTLQDAEEKLVECSTAHTYYDITTLLNMQMLKDAEKYFSQQEIEDIPWLRVVSTVISQQAEALSDELNEFITLLKAKNNYNKVRLEFLLLEIEEYCGFIRQTSARVAVLTNKVPMAIRANWE